MFPYLYRVNLFNEIISIPHVYFFRQIISLFRETSKCSLIISCGNASISMSRMASVYVFIRIKSLGVDLQNSLLCTFNCGSRSGVSYLGKATNVWQIKKYLWTLGKMLWTREKIFSCERSGPRSISRWLQMRLHFSCNLKSVIVDWTMDFA